MVTLQLYDLMSLAQNGVVQEVIGRQAELRRLRQMLHRSVRHHVAIVGPVGCGKEALVEGLAWQMAGRKAKSIDSAQDRTEGEVGVEGAYQLDCQPLEQALLQGGVAGLREGMTQLGQQLGRCAVMLHGAGSLVGEDPGRRDLFIQIVTPLLQHGGIRLVLPLTEQQAMVFWQNSEIRQLFDRLEMRSLPADDSEVVIGNAVGRMESVYECSIEGDVAREVVAVARKVSCLALPGAAIELLDEVCAAGVSQGQMKIDGGAVRALVEEKLQVPAVLRQTGSDLIGAGGLALRALEERLNERVVGQPQVARMVVGALERSALGLTQPGRPRGSFLLVGPSGVGKTETAKALAELVFGAEERMVRLDMSEYGESHAAVRLIGSPPGYVGYEEGGQLTEPVRRQPYSLVLLDELEKAHPRIFDMFLQVLEDGRLTDSAGSTVDFGQTLILATSNCVTREIVSASGQGIDVTGQSFVQEVLWPVLLEHFRPEFLNRFDGIAVYQPLTVEALVQIAWQELHRLEQRLGHREIRFALDTDWLTEKIAGVAEPLLGARTVRRFIQRSVEEPLARRLLAEPQLASVVVTEEDL